MEHFILGIYSQGTPPLHYLLLGTLYRIAFEVLEGIGSSFQYLVPQSKWPCHMLSDVGPHFILSGGSVIWRYVK